MGIRTQLSVDFAAISFLILYPLYFFYNAAIAFGYISPVFGDRGAVLYGAYSVIVTLIYITCFAPLAKDVRFQTIWLMKLLYIFVGWFLFWVSLNYLFNRDSYVDASSFKLFCCLIMLLANFAIGCHLGLMIKWFRVVLLVLWFCMLVFVLSTFDHETLSVHGGLYRDEIKGLEGLENFASYQGFARSALLTSFIILAITKTFAIRLLVEAISLVILFFLSARSELVGFLFAVMVFESLVSLKKPSRIFVLAFFGCFAAIFLAYFNNSFLPDISDSRVAALSDLADDHSWQMRSDFNDRAFMQIIDNPLFGKFGGEYYEGIGAEGTYAHNILSVWVSLGLPGFLLYLSLLLGSFLVAMKNVFRTGGNSDLWNLTLLTSVTALLLSLFAKSIHEVWFALVLGLLVNVGREELRLPGRRTLE